MITFRNLVFKWLKFLRTTELLDFNLDIHVDLLEGVLINALKFTRLCIVLCRERLFLTTFCLHFLVNQEVTIQFHVQLVGVLVRHVADFSLVAKAVLNFRLVS